METELDIFRDCLEDIVRFDSKTELVFWFIEKAGMSSFSFDGHRKLDLFFELPELDGKSFYIQDNELFSHNFTRYVLNLRYDETFPYYIVIVQGINFIGRETKKLELKIEIA